MFFGRNEFKLLSDTNDMQERHFLFKFCDKYRFKVEEGRNGGHVQTQKSHFCEKSETHRSLSLSFFTLTFFFSLSLSFFTFLNFVRKVTLTGHSQFPSSFIEIHCLMSTHCLKLTRFIEKRAEMMEI